MAEGSWKGNGFLDGVGIPAPSGRYRVGSVDLMVKLEGDDLGGLMVRLFYPTGASPGTGRSGDGFCYAPWFPSKNYVRGYLEFNKSKFSGIASSIISTFMSPKMPALLSAPLLEAGHKEGTDGPEAPPTFPALVFSHGLGAMRTTYSGITCDLASHGYIVASVEHRDRSACISHRRVPKSGRQEGQFQDEWLSHRFLQPGEDEFTLRNGQVKQRADECRKTLDILGLLNDGASVCDMMGSGFDFKQFKGRVDISTVGVLGHSFGGSTSVLALQEDSRFKCGMALDGWMLPLYKVAEDSVGSSVSQPLYFINAYTFQWKDNVLKMLSLCSPPDSLGRTPRRVVTLDETEHMNQTDILFVAPSIMQRWVGADMSTKVDALTAHRVNMLICHSFFKRHLLKDLDYEAPVAELDGIEGHSPVIIFGTNVDLDQNDEQTSDQNTKQTSDQNAEQTSGQKDEQTSDQKDEQTSDQKDEQTSDQKDEQTSDQKDEQTSDQKDEQTSDQKDEQTSDQKDEQTSDLNDEQQMSGGSDNDKKEGSTS